MNEVYKLFICLSKSQHWLFENYRTSSINKSFFFVFFLSIAIGTTNLFIFTEINGSQIMVVPINSLLLHRRFNFWVDSCSSTHQYHQQQQPCSIYFLICVHKFFHFGRIFIFQANQSTKNIKRNFNTLDPVGAMKAVAWTIQQTTKWPDIKANKFVVCQDKAFTASCCCFYLITMSFIFSFTLLIMS